jgi:lipopolysaccharide export system ATP-binding protein
MDASFHARDLKKTYNVREVVKSVSIDVERGEVVGLLGPNGAGKTTSFYMMVGLVKADKGQINLESENVTDLPLHLRAKKGIGYLPQEASVFRELTVEENIFSVLEVRDLS